MSVKVAPTQDKIWLRTNNGGVGEIRRGTPIVRDWNVRRHRFTAGATIPPRCAVKWALISCDVISGILRCFSPHPSHQMPIGAVVTFGAHGISEKSRRKWILFVEFYAD